MNAKDDDYQSIEKPLKFVGKAWVLKHKPTLDIMKPRLDAPPVSTYIELKATERKLENVNGRLKKKREQALKRKALLEAQWLDIEDKEKTFKESFLKFNSFLRANLEKRERTMKKLKNDQELHASRLIEIERLNKNKAERSVVAQKMKDEIRKLYIYQDYLMKVVNESAGEFKDIMDPLKRMELLLTARDDLQDRQNRELLILENSKKDSKAYLEHQHLIMMGLNNTLATLRSQYEDTIRRTLEMDRIIVDAKVTLGNMSSELKELERNIENIYVRVTIRKNLHRKPPKKSLNEQLGDISFSLRNFSKSIELINERRQTPQHHERRSFKKK